MNKLLQHPRSQALITCLVISLLGLIFRSWYFPITGGILLILSLISTGFRDAFLFQFQRLMKAIGKVKSVVFMGIVFYVVLLPLALIFRLFRKKKYQNGSRFIERNHQYTAADLEQMW
ncbi:MAG: SxtJ family membrane protein [Bacteroidia bacterium]